LPREEAARQGRGEESRATALRGGTGSGPIGREKTVGAVAQVEAGRSLLTSPLDYRSRLVPGANATVDGRSVSV
jgi:hypothetical protein